jgi:hypothetical protein
MERGGTMSETTITATADAEFEEQIKKTIADRVKKLEDPNRERIPADQVWAAIKHGWMKESFIIKESFIQEGSLGL